MNVFYLESSPAPLKSEITLLLLHGMRFSSSTWLEVETIQTLSAGGYRVLAVDLPGFGKTAKGERETAKGERETEREDKGGFLSSLIKSLGISQPVIVSPSFSGYYTLPLLMRDWRSFKGFIPVAPVGQDVLLQPIHSSCHGSSSSCSGNISCHGSPSSCSGNISCPGKTVTSADRFNQLPDYFKSQIKDPIPDLSCIDTPTLVVHGQHDRSLSSAILSLIPTARSFEIPDGDHPAYLKNPLLWNTIVYNFLQRLDRL